MSKTGLQLAFERELCALSLLNTMANYQLQLDRILANYETATFALRTFEAQSTAPNPNYITKGELRVYETGWVHIVKVTVDGATDEPKSVELVK